MRFHRRLGFLIVVLIPLLLSGCISLAEDITPPPNYKPPTPAPQVTAQVNATYPMLPPDPAQGAAIYAEKCQACHGATGMGDGPQAGGLPNPPAAIGSVEVARPSKPIDWFNLVSNGNLERYMPGFSGSLDDRQRWDVVAYVYTLSATSQELEQGKAAYNASCAGCHGENGNGDGPNAASQNPAPASWNDQARLAQLSADDMVSVMTGGKEGHPNLSPSLDDSQRYAVAAYVRSLSFAGGNSQPVTASTPDAALQAGSAGTVTPGAQDNPLPTSQPANLTITGKITNGTPGGSIPDGLDVKLTAYAGMAPAFDTSSKAAADGSFRFENIEFQPDYVYLAEVTANGVTFTSDILHGTDVSGNSADLPLQIYDTTTDTATLRTDRLHVFFDFSNSGTVQVINLFIISNNGDKVVVPQQTDGPVINFTLPKEAKNLMFQDGELGGRYIQTDNGFGDRMYVVPGQGQHQVLFAYEMPYDKKLALDIQVPLPVDAATVMVPPMGVKLKSDQVVDAGQQNVQGMSFQMYQATNSLSAGDTLKLNLSGKVGSGAAAAGNTTMPLLFGAGALVLALAGVGYWFFRQQRANSQVAANADEEVIEPSETSDSLLEAIVTLDDLHASGKLPEESYQERRAELKTRLSAAMARENGEG